MEDDSWGVGDDVMFVRGSGWGWLLSCHLPPLPPPPPQDDTLEETGWKLVHGDVFRPPLHPTLLTACLGSGIQIFSMILIIIGRSFGDHGISLTPT